MKTFCRLLLLLTTCSLSAIDNTTGGLTFEDAARMAVENSVELKHAYASAVLQKDAWKLGLREFFPNISFSASEDDRLAELSTDSFAKRWQVSCDQLLYDGGKISSARKIEKAQIFLNDKILDYQAEEIASSALAAYESVLRGRLTLAIREENLASLEAQRDILILEVDMGKALDVDLREANLTVEQARLEIELSKIELESAEHTLEEALGCKKLPLLLEHIDINKYPPLPPDDEDAVIMAAGNMQMREALAGLKQKEEEYKAAKLSWLPELRATGSISLSGNHYPLSRLTWQAGLSLSFNNPLLNSKLTGIYGKEGTTDTTAQASAQATPLPSPASALNIKSAKLALNLERQRYALTAARNELQAKNAASQCRLAIEKQRMAGNALEIARKRFEIDAVKRDLGLVTNIELMQSRLTLADKEIDCVDAAIAAIQASRALKTFLGGQV